MTPLPTVAFKIADRAEWSALTPDATYAGSAVDLADGYIHMSTADQLAETARRHYAGRGDLLLLTIDLSGLGEALRWEASRGGDLFPHLYAPLPVVAAIRTRQLAVDDAGRMRFDDGDPTWG